MKLHIGTTKNEDFFFPLQGLKKHVITLGSSGSGKTVLSKVFIEEASLHNIPALVIDPQGDLASLALKAEKATKNLPLPVRVFTPISQKGIPCCINPLKKVLAKNDEKVLMDDSIATGITSLLGYNLQNEQGQSTKAILYTLLSKQTFESFEALASHIESNTHELREELSAIIINDKQLPQLARKIRLLTIGKNRLLFENGFKLDIEAMFAQPAINIIYLNSLHSFEEKEFFVTMLVQDLYNWMLQHPSDSLQALFMMDEIAPFIPAGAQKPLCKEILLLLFKQARKYGIGCLMATQNPGDIDYKAFAQFGTWNIGRLTTKQDQKKVQDSLKSISSMDITSMLPKLQPGNFLMFSPDNYPHVVAFKTRWLYTKHTTLSIDDVESLDKNFIASQTKQAQKQKPFAIKSQDRKNIEQEHTEIFTQNAPQKKQTIKSESKIDETTIRREIKRTTDPDTPQLNAIAVNIDETQLKKHMYWHVQKTFFFPREKLIDFTLSYHQLERLEVIQKKSFFGIIRDKTYTIFIDTTTGNLLNKNLQSVNLSNLESLTPSQYRILSFLLGKTRITKQEIAYKLEMNQDTVETALTQLQKRKLVAFRKDLKTSLWYHTTKLPTHIAPFHVTQIQFEETKKIPIQKTTEIKPTLQILKEWFGLDIMAQSVAYLPVYKITLQSLKGKRSVLVNAHNGALFI